MTKLPQIIGERLFGRLELIRLQPQLIVDLSTAAGHFTQPLQQYYNNAQVIALDFDGLQALPFSDHAVDFVFSNLLLQNYLDPASLFQEIKRVLKPEGLFLFTTLGPDTFQELQEIMSENAFMDMHNIGDCLIQTQFSGPVLDQEKITLTYHTLSDLLEDIKDLGGDNFFNHLIDHRNFSQQQQQIQRTYEKFRLPSGLLPLTLEVIYGLAWRPALSKTSFANSAGEVYIPIRHIQKGNS